MGEDSEHFRKRARECRDLSLRARDPEIRDMLVQLAGELEEEADSLDRDGSETAAASRAAAPDS
jgi:hypothetical protein